jgi:hypothetical protein
VSLRKVHAMTAYTCTFKLLETMLMKLLVNLLEWKGLNVHRQEFDRLVFPS